MEIDWSDTLMIADLLCEKHPDTDPLSVRFTDLRDWVMELPGFVGKAERCNERLLEAIQMAWVDEKD